ncbi:MAG: hypothetical protein ACNYPG_04085 [Candidatus Porifericomitaceae bacterium WSBS_2022_MAG_OTU9]
MIDSLADQVQFGTIAITFAYVLLAVLLLSLNLRSSWSWLVKIAAIVITSAFYIISYISLPPLFGWPVEQQPPERFNLIAAQVDQPDKQIDFPGAIYLWARPLSDRNPPLAPRAYQLKYTNLRHEAILTAQQKLQRGIQQVGELQETVPSIGQPTDEARLASAIDKLSFYDLPDPMLILEK